MKKTIDFNKLAKAHKAKKAWEKVQQEKIQDESELESKKVGSRRAVKSHAVVRKSS